MRVYHPLHKKAFRQFAANAARFGTLASNHDKILRSGDMVITGGRNISKDYFTTPEGRSDVYRDADILLTGKAASLEAKKAFDLEFEQDVLHFEIYDDSFGNFPRRDTEMLGAYAMMEAWTDGDPRLLACIPSLRFFVHTGEQKLHAKTAVADDEIALVSSYNLDLLSEKVNGEIAVVAHSKPLSKQLADSCRADRSNPAHGIKEYRIERSADGSPVIRNGEPVVAFGPEDHVGWLERLQLGGLRWLVRQARKLPLLSDIPQPSLRPRS